MWHSSSISTIHRLDLGNVGQQWGIFTLQVWGMFFLFLFFFFVCLMKVCIFQVEMKLLCLFLNVPLRISKPGFNRYSGFSWFPNDTLVHLGVASLSCSLGLQVQNSKPAILFSDLVERSETGYCSKLMGKLWELDELVVFLFVSVCTYNKYCSSVKSVQRSLSRWERIRVV